MTHHEPRLPEPPVGGDHAQIDPSENRKREQLLSLQKRRCRADYIELARMSDQGAALVADSDWTQVDSAELSALLAEYESLRSESLAAINSRLQTLLFGLAAIGAMVGGVLTIDRPEESPLLIWLVFSIALPLVSSLVLVIWAGEAMRIKRAGDYVSSHIEARVNQKFRRLVMAWEASLKIGAYPRDYRFGPSLYVAIFVFVTATLAPMAGLVITSTPFKIGIGVPLWQVYVPWIIIGLTVVYLAVSYPRYKNSPIVESPFLGL